jgi:RNA polymerase sigma factor (sigma-70 family)
MSEAGYIEVDFDKVFTVIYRRYSKAVFSFFCRFIFDDAVSEELCQDVFLKLIERKKMLDPYAPQTLSYLFKAARNTAIDYIRRKKREDEKIRSIYFAEIDMDRQFYENLENSWMRGEVISTLRDTINALPEKRRSLFIARHFHNKSGASLARDSGISIYRFKKMEEQVNQKIREKLGPYFERSEKS